MSAAAIPCPEAMQASPAQTSGQEMPASANACPEPMVRTPTRADGGLAMIAAWGATLDDLERLRIQVGNRVAALERDYGMSLPELDGPLDLLRQAEHQIELSLVREWRKQPLAPWARAIPGCGEKLIARLISVIGDPGERPNVGKLWAYCGHGAPSKRRRGMTQDELFALGNPAAKKATWKLAYQFMRTVGSEKSGARSPYRDLYEERKEATEGKLHSEVCVRCGPSGKPAQPGSPWSDAHRHADALRYVGKTFLRDLWIAARQEVHEARLADASGTPLDPGPEIDEAHIPSAGVQDTAALHDVLGAPCRNEGGTLSDSGHGWSEVHNRTAEVRNLSEVVS